MGLGKAYKHLLFRYTFTLNLHF